MSAALQNNLLCVIKSTTKPSSLIGHLLPGQQGGQALLLITKESPAPVQSLAKNSLAPNTIHMSDQQVECYSSLAIPEHALSNELYLHSNQIEH